MAALAPAKSPAKQQASSATRTSSRACCARWQAHTAVQTEAGDLEETPSAMGLPRFLHDFSQVPAEARPPNEADPGAEGCDHCRRSGVLRTLRSPAAGPAEVPSVVPSSMPPVVHDTRADQRQPLDLAVPGPL